MKSTYFIVTFLLYLLYGCTGEDEVLVVIGKQELMREEYLEQLRNRYPENTNYNFVADSIKSDILDRLINKKLKVRVALDSNLHQNPEFMRGLRSYENKELKEKYIEKKIWDKLITSEEIDDYIDKLKNQIRITQIIIGYNSARYYARRSKADALKLADNIHNMLASGKRFSYLVRMYSDDQGARMNGGDLGYRNWDQYPETVRDIIWQMAVGEISKPVETPLGIYVVRVDAKKKVPPYKSAKNEANILKAKRFYAQVYADTIRTMTSEEEDRIKDRYRFKLLRIHINNLAALITQKVNANNAQSDAFSSEEREMTLAEWQGGNVTFNTLLDKYSKNYNTAIRKFAQMTFLNREVEKIGSDALMAFAAREAAITVEDDIQRYMEKELVAIVDRQMIRNKIVFSEENLQRYYQENLTQFVIPDRIELWVMDVSSQKEAERMINRAETGQNFEDLVQRFARNSRLKEQKGYLGFISEDDFGDLSQTAFNHKGNSKIIGPVRYRNNLYVLKTGRFRESQVAPFETVRNRVYRQYERSQYTLIEKNLIGDLISRYGVQLNKKVYHEI
jgi:parvulin-like peptidyl-prolyl isomerase